MLTNCMAQSLPLAVGTYSTGQVFPPLLALKTHHRIHKIFHSRFLSSLIFSSFPFFFIFHSPFHINIRGSVVSAICCIQCSIGVYQRICGVIFHSETCVT